MYVAYETLPAKLKARIEGRKAVHDGTYNSAGVMRKGYHEVTDPRKAPGAQHPLIRTHPETGRPCLFLGRRRNSYIVGMELDESEALLDELWAHATQAQFTFCQQWRRATCWIWDNRCTLHRRDSFDPNARRLMLAPRSKGRSAARLNFQNERASRPRRISENPAEARDRAGRSIQRRRAARGPRAETDFRYPGKMSERNMYHGG